MYRPRIIPVLLLQNDYLVKSIKFSNYHYIGDPINAIKIYNDLEADEIVVLDITATNDKRLIDLDFVKQLGEECNMPFSVGGGIKTLEDIQKIIAAGAERVIIGHQATQDFNFIKDACNTFGSSTISVCIDVNKTLLGKNIVSSRNAKISHKLSPIDFALKMEELGVGEIIIQSVWLDGTQKGYDTQLFQSIIEKTKIPVVCLGGAKSKLDLQNLFKKCKPNGIAAGSLFVYQGENKGVLINYLNKEDKKNIYA
jgi:cyclase